ncbi:hypothetical protein BOTBODRAFT_199770 [Botryobasidium botryosum FD-172 SS1]|uniref:Uncharacterized protein n=1 Tax=Botryobasidium botryosum (strain FD-172 SS1) TaxID=930990 RepID=A0A067NC74_BOTB1|nr:hypothetical protein BOTBODRAFT_199770 [Botryobasidium botryosum FD-172 SS1]
MARRQSREALYKLLDLGEASTLPPDSPAPSASQCSTMGSPENSSNTSSSYDNTPPKSEDFVRYFSEVYYFDEDIQGPPSPCPCNSPQRSPRKTIPEDPTANTEVGTMTSPSEIPSRASRHAHKDRRLSRRRSARIADKLLSPRKTRSARARQMLLRRRSI